jgi:exfoliative toxin A/B
LQHLLKQVPIPMSGLMLGLFSLVKLSIFLELELLGILFFALGITTWALLVLKILFAFDSVLMQLKNPVIASVAPTFTMGTMVLASIIMPHYSMIKYLWMAALALQILLFCYFIKTFILTKSFSLQTVLPSWFILFVGFGIAPVTFGHVFPTLTQIIFWFGLGCYSVILPLVLTRLYKHSLAEGAKPLIAILCAPVSLLSVGYLEAFTTHSETLLYGLFFLSQLFYIVVLIQMPKLLKLPFYPSYAAFTFPLVISAIAVERMYVHSGLNVFHYISYLEFVIGALVVLYVYIRYTRFLQKSMQPVQVAATKM